VGGSLLSIERLGVEVAQLTARVLRGERVEDIPVTTIDPYVLEFDGRQLRRWNLDESRLPPGAVVTNRQPSAWEQYRGVILITIVVIVVEALLIAGLLVQGRRRRRAEGALRESEQRFRLLADTAPVLIRRSRVDKQCDFFNKPWLEFRGRAPEQEAGFGWSEGVHRDDLDRCLQTYNSAFDARRPFRMEYRLLRADGEYRWVLDTGVPRFAADGSFAGYIGSCLDITERREIEQANRDLAGRLITAQEVERTRIARELHDDVGQRLASMSLEIGLVKRRLPDAPPGVQDDLAGLQQTVQSLSSDLRVLSHELHPSVLKHLGLVEALKARCDEMQVESGMTVDLAVAAGLGDVPADAALCLYRVAQEALRNIVKHAQAGTARVSLRRDNGHLAMRVIDDGHGFDRRSVERTRLGLVSLDERVRMLNGTFAVESSRESGTTVSAILPIGDAHVTASSADRG
jgi:PAS domain S-box-containing protein